MVLDTWRSAPSMLKAIVEVLMTEHSWTSALSFAAMFSAGLAAAPAQAQPFTNVKGAAVDYSRTDSEPRTKCEDLAKLMDKEIVHIEARTVPVSDEAPEHCRVSGVLSPEIGFELNLPVKWNRRFYMIGN